MTCNKSSNVSFEFLKETGETYLEIRPREMQFDRTRGKFDHCSAEFSQEVVDHLQPLVEEDGSVFRQPLLAFIKIEDTAVYRLLWVPEAARFTGNEVHVEFHDPQKFLTRGEIDWRRDNVKLEEAYRYVFERRDTSGPEIFNDIKFTVPEEAYEELRTQFRDGPLGINYKGETERETEDIITGGDTATATSAQITELEEENIYNIIDGHYAIDFDRISPWKAINRLNKKFGVTTWAGPDGNLWVGARSTTGYQHYATPDDGRVWKLTDYNITPPRDPVIRSRVRGGWADDPSESHAENIFWEIESLNHGTEEFRIEGVATLKDSTYGQEIVTDINAKRDALEDIAKRKMMNKQRQQWEGYIEIDPEDSGREITNPRHVEIGDSIRTIPPDSDGSGVCDTNIRDSLFNVVGIQHSLTSAGNWNLRLDVVPVLQGALSPENIDTRLRYYDPAAKEFLEEEDLEENDNFWPEDW